MSSIKSTNFVQMISTFNSNSTFYVLCFMRLSFQA